MYQFVASSNNAVTLKPAKPKSKLDGWAAWNKAFCMFTEIYCMKYLIEVLSCSSIQAA